MFHEGQQIGSYTLLRRLGKGGFGEVWLAEKRSQLVTKKVAVKLPLPDQINLDAIRQEAELWEQASGHPNVLPIIDADVIDGQVLIVSEYADGGSLYDVLKTYGKLSLENSVEVTIGVLNGLEFLHHKRIIHRDIKPQNILLQGRTPRLADFGISRAMQTAAISSTIIGTDSYMAPESFEGKRTVQTDIWSVGVLLYSLLTDKLPFPQEHPSERMFAILTREFEPLPNDVPNGLQRIVNKALAKLPENRYQTAKEMREDLQKSLIGIAHPTLAKTEVLQLPISNQNLSEVTRINESFKTQEPEKETIISSPSPVVTTSPILPESIVSQIPVATTVTATQTLPTQSRALAERSYGGKNNTLLFGLIGGGVFATLVLVLIGFIGYKVSQSDRAMANKNTSSNTTNTATNTTTNVNTNKSTNANTSNSTPTKGEIRKNSFGMEFVYILPGDFQMGTEDRVDREGPVHKVIISQAFWMGKEREVTQAQWQAVMGNNPSYFKDCEQCPVDSVSWDDAQQFIAKLNAQNDGNKYRLPSEVEWEYAAKAGATLESPGNVDAVGWYEQNSDKKTHPVASKQPNYWGLYDMHGNVNEWCEDRYGRLSSLTTTDPVYTESYVGPKRVLRGGGWFSPAVFVNSTIRAMAEPTKRADAVGFRVVRQ